ncbi:BPTI/Kunitz domain-containing protein [Girardinichthys multiradiatus]|uniref:BPTI/Kunitz domain-containing protein n=1 Tax=Girardinichthys multiradiatus TaxID=208333 RepID=UPI001FAD3585|nr:BPTI/Kunitz domain-containing protein [Girardinichthys multiradiatus]
MKKLMLLGIFMSALHISNSQKQDFCRLPSDAGQGTTFSFSVFYNYTTDQCLPFFYQGEGGNANRFQNERECLRNCSSSAEKIYPMDVKEACHFKHLVGGCSGRYLRYYYDSTNEKCKRFIWTGCFGNGNRFFDYNSCNATCAGIRGDLDATEEDEPDTPIAIICGVLLALVVSAILITVIVLVVKSKKKKQKKARAKTKDAKIDSPLQEGDIEMT